MLVKGTYTSVWDDCVSVISKIEADTEKRTIECLEEPREIDGFDSCTDEYVTLPWNPYTKKIDPNGTSHINAKAFQEDDDRQEDCEGVFYTYE